MKKLKENWEAFLLVILDPWNLLLIGATDATLDDGPNALKITRMMPEGKGEARDMFVKNLKHYHCVPDNVTAGQIQRVFVRWAREHPEKLHEPAAKLAQKAFAKAWPCKL